MESEKHVVDYHFFESDDPFNPNDSPIVNVVMDQLRVISGGIKCALLRYVPKDDIKTRASIVVKRDNMKTMANDFMKLFVCFEKKLMDVAQNKEDLSKLRAVRVIETYAGIRDDLPSTQACNILRQCVVGLCSVGKEAQVMLFNRDYEAEASKLKKHQREFEKLCNEWLGEVKVMIEMIHEAAPKSKESEEADNERVITLIKAFLQ